MQCLQRAPGILDVELNHDGGETDSLRGWMQALRLMPPRGSCTFWNMPLYDARQDDEVVQELRGKGFQVSVEAEAEHCDMISIKYQGLS